MLEGLVLVFVEIGVGKEREEYLSEGRDEWMGCVVRGGGLIE